MTITASYKKAFAALVLIFAIAFLMTSCGIVRKTSDDGLAGYGHPKHLHNGTQR